MYIEGANFHMNHPSSPLFEYMGMRFIGRGENQEAFHLFGQAGTFTDGFRFDNAGGNDSHYRIDQVAADGGTLLFADETNMGRVICNESTGYRTVFSAVIFGALYDYTLTHTRADLMNQYLSFLDPGWNGN